MRAYLEDVLEPPWTPRSELVSDDREPLRALLSRLADDAGCDLVLTSGGTGPAPRDVTPDVTAEVCDRLLPGFAEEMRRVSRLEVATAILSRQTVGHRGSCLLVNLPGSPRAISTCLGAILPVVPHCLALIGARPLRLRADRLPTARAPHPDPAKEKR